MSVGRMRVTARVLALSGAALAWGVDEARASQAFIDHVVRRESGGNWAATNGTSSALGGGQIMFDTARANGMITGTRAGGNGLSAWSGANWNTEWAQRWNIRSTQDFIANPAAQQDAIRMVAASNYRSLGNTSDLIGQQRHGLTLNDAMLVECAYILGGRGCRGALNGEEPFLSQAMSNRAFQRMAGAANLDVSSVTGRAGQAGGGQAIDPGTGQALPNERPLIEGLFCDPEILRTIQQHGAQEVDRRVAIAADPRLGYSTLNGQGVLAMAGVGGGVSPGMGTNSTFLSMSCIDRILNTGLGLGNLFQLPTWSQLQSMAMRMMENFVCGQANQLFARAMQPVNTALYSNAHLDNFLPGAGAVVGQMGLPTSISPSQFVRQQQGWGGGGYNVWTGQSASPGMPGIGAPGQFGGLGGGQVWGGGGFGGASSLLGAR